MGGEKTCNFLPLSPSYANLWMSLLLHTNLFCARERKELGRFTKKNHYNQPWEKKAKKNQAVCNLLENGLCWGCNRSM